MLAYPLYNTFNSGSSIESYNVIVDQSNGREIYKSNESTHYQTQLSDIVAQSVHYDAKTKIVKLTNEVIGRFE